MMTHSKIVAASEMHTSLLTTSGEIINCASDEYAISDAASHFFFSFLND